MKQLLQLAAIEIRLQFRSKTFWLVGVLTAVIAQLLPVGILLIQFAIINAVTRDERSGFAAIISAAPHNTFKLVLARALAVLCLLLGVGWVVLLVIGVLPYFFSVEMVPAEWLFDSRRLAFIWLKYIITCLIAIGFVFLAGAVTRYSRRLYLICGVCWGLGVWFANSLSYLPTWSMLFVFGHALMLPSLPSAAVGYFPQQDLLPGIVVYQGAVAMLFLLLAALWQMAKRGEPILRSKLLVSLMLIVVTVGIAAGFIVWRELDERERGFRLRLAAVEKQETIVSEVRATPALKDYQLNVKLQTAAHYLEGKATLKLKPIAPYSDIIYFTLRDCFMVEEVAITGGNERLEWWRDGSRLAVNIPERYQREEELTLTISYSGKVWEWFSGRLARPTGPVNFIAAPFSLLRSGYAWYPVPGDQPLYTHEYYEKRWDSQVGTTLWAKRTVHSPVPFALTVDIDTDSTVVSNLEQTGDEVLTGEYKQRYRFKSSQGRDVFLLTGPYHCEKRKISSRNGFVEVYSYRQHQARVSDVLDELAAPYLFYEDMLQPEQSYNLGGAPSAKLYTVVEIPTFFAYTKADYSDDDDFIFNLTLTDTVLISEYHFRGDKWRWSFKSDIQANKYNMAVLQRWWQEDITVMGEYCDGNITESLMYYLAALYAEKTWGRMFYEQAKQSLLTKTKTDLKQFAFPFAAGGPVVRDVFMTMDTIRSELGDLAIKKIMRELYAVYIRKRTIDPTDFSQVVETATARADWPQEKREEIHRLFETIAQQSNELQKRKIKSTGTIFEFNPEEWL